MPLRLVDQVVVLPLKDRLEVFLEVTACDLGHHGEVEPGARLHIADIRAYHLYPAVFHLFHPLGGRPLDGNRLAATHLKVDILAADPLTLERRSVGDGYRHLRNLDLQAPHFHCLLHDVVVRDVRDNVFVGADARGKHFRDRRISDRGEAPVDAARCIGIPFVGDVAKRHHKGIRPVLVINQIFSEVARLHPAKGHGNTTGKAYGKDSLVYVRAEGDKPRGPADLYTGLHELF